MANTVDEIMDVTESLIRRKGYQGFSFREIAEIVSIKSASVHYHFPTKDGLCLAILRRYLTRFEAALDEASNSHDLPMDQILHYINMYRHESKNNESIPLCVVLATDIEVLSDDAVDELQEFYRLNLRWLKKTIAQGNKSLNEKDIKRKAAFIFSAMGGSLVTTRTLRDKNHFELVAETIVEQCHLMFNQ